ncbi:alpha/beta hydrolase [Antrihabitans sp. YC2-6]|uniref:alpha/beta hydrolase n=1 Tax=Antrihabitans sp. YC2-6 TaxID=2799498 RepID=UPI0018F4967C|nr:alpha/beta hydrolase [Antrihabitans sp. YC2-6]MBJ8343593.1 alpha/beta hydrolase [Antrihabitans sp. YC2-6]
MRPPQLPLSVVGATLRPYYRLALNHRLPYRAQRRLLDLAAPIQTLPPRVQTQSLMLGDRPAEKVWADANNGTAVLYLHGGGYTTGSIATHRSLAAHIARRAGVAVFLLDYRLAPEHPFPAAPDDAVAAFVQLVRRHGYKPGQIALGGDSAGGGLAVATARRLIDEHDLHPGALALIAPWVDPNAVSELRADLVVTSKWSRNCAKAYLGDADPHDPGYAPMLGNLAGLPPTLIHVGTDELLYPQEVEFVELLRAAGVDVTFVEYPELWHVAHLQASLLREAAHATKELSAFLKASLEPKPTSDTRAS